MVVWLGFWPPSTVVHPYGILYLPCWATNTPWTSTQGSRGSSAPSVRHDPNAASEASVWKESNPTNFLKKKQPQFPDLVCAILIHFAELTLASLGIFSSWICFKRSAHFFHLDIKHTPFHPAVPPTSHTPAKPKSCCCIPEPVMKKAWENSSMMLDKTCCDSVFWGSCGFFTGKLPASCWGWLDWWEIEEKNCRN